MIGNVAEWVQDKYGSYSAGAVTDPTGPTVPFASTEPKVSAYGRGRFTGDNHVLRGSSWGSFFHDSRISVRSYVVRVDQGGSSVGFRVVREPISPEQLASIAIRPIQGTVVSDSAIPTFEIEFVARGGATQVVKISSR